ncbi:hypothetical protein DESC_700212 [Desulfosarcina cetonica]|nr:hypothetical protein DESC_700212 [Desulfosarcina cetonica]
MNTIRQRKRDYSRIITLTEPSDESYERGKVQKTIQRSIIRNY